MSKPNTSLEYPINQEFEEAIQDFDPDLQTFARVNFYDREFPLNPKRRPLASSDIKRAFAIIDEFRKPLESTREPSHA